MNNVKRKDRSNLVGVIINTLMGVILWLITAGVISWLISSNHLNESLAVAVAPVVQGVIVYTITMLTYFGMREGRSVALLLTPGIYLVLQIATALLFWDTNLTGVFRGGIAGMCGVVLAVITYKSTGNKSRRNKAIRNRSR